MTRLDGRVCLVTGAGGGIGAATCSALAAKGATVLGTDRAGAELDAALERGDEVARLAGDLDQPVDVLVNCAGAGLVGPVAELDARAVERLVALNLTAPILLTRALLPRMLERRSGHVVNVASLVAHLPMRLEATYAATKAGLAGFTRSLRAELRGSGVGASLVSPAVVQTAFFARRGAPYTRRFPRPVPPERVAAAIVEAIEHDRAEVVVPRWLTVPVRLYGVAPGVYRALSRRVD